MKDRRIADTATVCDLHGQWPAAAAEKAGLASCVPVGNENSAIEAPEFSRLDSAPERTADLARKIRSLEQSVAERDCALEAMQRQQQTLRQLLSLHERERQLIAYEIHDGFVQQVTGAKMLLESFRRTIAQKPEEAWKTFAAGLRSLGQSIAEARRLIGGLRPPILEESGLAAALEYLVYEMQQDGGPQIHLQLRGIEIRLAPMLENATYRIVQECLTNAFRHSRSDRIRVRLAVRSKRVRITVRDWGIGFRPHAVPASHFGLRGICERAALFGGKAQVRAAPGRGTCISVELPVLKAVIVR